MKIKNNVKKGALKVVASAIGIAVYTVYLPVDYALGVISLVEYANEKVNEVYDK